MSDRLTQLQVCLDQLVEQFNATVNYVNAHSEPALLDEDPASVSSIAANAPLPGQGGAGSPTNGANSTSIPSTSKVESEQAFTNTINELATDIILKSRQITMLIDSLPGIGVSPENQLRHIQELSDELVEVEKRRIHKIEEKDQLMRQCETLIKDMANGISSTK